MKYNNVITRIVWICSSTLWAMIKLWQYKSTANLLRQRKKIAEQKLRLMFSLYLSIRFLCCLCYYYQFMCIRDWTQTCTEVYRWREQLCIRPSTTILKLISCTIIFFAHSYSNQQEYFKIKMSPSNFLKVRKIFTQYITKVQIIVYTSSKNSTLQSAAPIFNHCRYLWSSTVFCLQNLPKLVLYKKLQIALQQNLSNAYIKNASSTVVEHCK